MNSIPEDYDTEDFQPVAYQQPFHANGSGNVLAENIYEDKSKIQAAGLRQTSLSQIGEKKRYRPPTMIALANHQGPPLGPGQNQQGMLRNVRSPSTASFVTTSSGGDRSSIYPVQGQQQQQQQTYGYPPQQYQPQQPQQHIYAQQGQGPPHPQMMMNRPLGPHQHQGQYIQQPLQQQQQHYNGQQFQPPMHYYNQANRSNGSILSPASSNTHLPLPQPKKTHYANQSSESLTPTSSSFEGEKNTSLPITPESLEKTRNEDKHQIEELNQKNDKLVKENGELNDMISNLQKQLQYKEEELELKNNIIDAKTKQLSLREEKLSNKEKQVDILNRKLAESGPQSDTVEVQKLQKTNESLSTKVISLLKEIDNIKENAHVKYTKVNEDLSAKVVSLLQEIDDLKAKSVTLTSPRVPFSPRSVGQANGTNTSKTLKDFSKEELFKLEFTKTLETLNQNQIYYENKIKILQDTIEEHKRLVFAISQSTKKNSTSSDSRKGLKFIDVVPPTISPLNKSI